MKIADDTRWRACGRCGHMIRPGEHYDDAGGKMRCAGCAEKEKAHGASNTMSPAALAAHKRQADCTSAEREMQ